MRLFILLSIFAGLFVAATNAASNLVCYYDSSSYTREGLGKLLNPDLDIALQFCSHLVYGYLGIRGDNYQAQSLNENLDIYKHQFSEITAFKRKHPHLKVLLSVGGDHDIDEEHPNKYIELLEGEKVRQSGFIQSAYALVKNYGFDGLDLAYQFPRNKPRKVHGEIGTVWKSFKKLFTGDFIVDTMSALHKEQFTAFVRDVKDALRADGFLLSLTVLPNVNSTWYFDIPALNGLVDFVNLAAFDFLTPIRNPEEADFTASLYALRRVSDPSKRHGNYAYRAVDGAVTEGIWISYDDADAASNKAAYVRAKNLGGVALFDLSYDDFRGQCSGEKYPILRSIKYRL